MSPRRALAALPLVALAALTLASACGSDDDTTTNPGGGGSGIGGAATGGSGGNSGVGGANGGSGGMGGSGGSDAGIDSAGDAPGDASACKLTKPYSSKNASCNTCAEQECCALINACYADAACDDGYVNCILACALLPGDAGDAGVASCLADCDTQYPTGKAEYDAAIGCADTKCAGPCG